MANPFDPDWLIYHDSHGSPENEKRQRMPYHVTVFPDGTVNYRDPGNPYGSPAPHAYGLNPKSLGLAYSGPVGGMPTPEGMKALQQEYEKIQARFPGMPGMGHGEAFEEHKKNPFALARPSKDGRSFEEASWRGSVGDMSNVPASGLRPLGLLPPSGEQAPPDVGPAVAGAAPRPYASAPRPSAPSTASPPPSPRMALGGPKPMPYDARTGEYVAPEVWKSRMGMGQDLLNAPIRGGKHGIAASAIEGLVGGGLLGWGQRGAQGNLDTEREVMRGAAGAQDMATLSGILTGSPVPAHQRMGMEFKIGDMQRGLPENVDKRRILAAQAKAAEEKEDPYKPYRIRAEVAKSYGMQPGTPEFTQFVLGTKTEPTQKLGFTDITKLTEEGGKYNSVASFADSFKDEFAGYGGEAIGNAATWMGRYTPILPGAASKEASGFWQEYDKYKNKARNDMFGSALTATEQAAFERADINPGMDPKIVRKNLDVQRQALKSAAVKKANALIQAGYDPAPIAAAYGLDLKQLGVQTQRMKGATSIPDGAPAPAQPPAATEAKPPAPDPLSEARDAIAKGAPREKVIERLRERGIDPAGL
jgi:hypothetical protein